jgi:hypothetical protein
MLKLHKVKYYLSKCLFTICFLVKFWEVKCLLTATFLAKDILRKSFLTKWYLFKCHLTKCFSGKRERERVTSSHCFQCLPLSTKKQNKIKSFYKVVKKSKFKFLTRWLGSGLSPWYINSYSGLS